MGQIVAVGNLKGGTGKTTIAVNLACCFGERGRSVALVDADPQAAATSWLGQLQKSAPTPMAVATGMPLSGEAQLLRWIEALEEARVLYDMVIIDLPPQAGPELESILRIADLFLVPITPSQLDLRAAVRTLQVVHPMRDNGRTALACMLIPSKVDRRTLLGRRARESLIDLGWAVGPTICQRSAHAEAFGAGQWIGGFRPGSDGHSEIEALAQEVQAILESRRSASDRSTEPVTSELSGVPERAARHAWIAAILRGATKADLFLRTWLVRGKGRGERRDQSGILALETAAADAALVERADHMVRSLHVRRNREGRRAIVNAGR